MANAMDDLKETTSAFDTLLEETISAVDECITRSKKINDELKNQATEKAAALLAEAQTQAETIISEADREGKTQAGAAMRKVGGLIEAARSSAGRVARPDRGQQHLTGDILAALETSIEQSRRFVLGELANLEQLETRLLEQETKLSEGQEWSQAKSNEADPDSAGSGHSEDNSEWQHSNGFKDVDDSWSNGAKEPGSKENGLGHLRQSGPTVPVIDPLEAGRNGDREISVQGGVKGSNSLAMGSHLYSGNVTMVILLKKASDDRTYQLTPEQISRRIKNTAGGSVVGSVMQGKQYFIKAHFETPVSLHDVLDGVSEWEDFEHQSEKVKEYQKQHGARFLPRNLKESKNPIYILVTL